MSGDRPDADALKALALAVVGLGLGIVAFRLQLTGGDQHLFTWGLGLACTGVCCASVVRLVKALRVRVDPHTGAPGTGRVLGAAVAMTVVGVAVFVLSSVLAAYLDSIGQLGAVGLVASLLSLLGPALLGGMYFHWLQQALCESGWNIGAALLVGIVCAGGSIYLWYALNVLYGPRVYQLIMS
ncbi:hypothetical protein BLA60_33330 [Actinophytocola xinjiangensis]|uniref:Uncharacterized protein n=1 Tax=Actinophytocola xinjiangensis TaxID=485602 RepID=A0A7Z1AVC0_9PSEU|nr:hypothetical protein [Actinophytocola xinjiangensis]OLF06213.1 hypothetical protein BLA60_33330 [Actinophytocola xinjiangensis]